MSATTRCQVDADTTAEVKACVPHSVDKSIPAQRRFDEILRIVAQSVFSNEKTSLVAKFALVLDLHIAVTTCCSRTTTSVALWPLVEEPLLCDMMMDGAAAVEVRQNPA